MFIRCELSLDKLTMMAKYSSMSLLQQRFFDKKFVVKLKLA